MRGTLTAFPYAKIGICVHHPITGYAGQPYAATPRTGRVTGNLPDAIGPQIHLDDGTDLPLFEPVNDLTSATCQRRPGQVLTSPVISGEMEDQRNWTDASYKSASTPAQLGYHHEASAGLLFDQSVVTRAAGFPAPAGRAQVTPPDADHGVADRSRSTALARRSSRPAIGPAVRQSGGPPSPAGPSAPCVPSPRRTCARTCDWPATRRPPT